MTLKNEIIFGGILSTGILIGFGITLVGHPYVCAQLALTVAITHMVRGTINAFKYPM